jgi:hypothetical protein
MSDPLAGPDDDSSLTAVDPALAELTEQITLRLQAGERVLAEDYITRYPDWAGPIRRLFPAVRDLVRLGRTVAGERDGAPVAGPPSSDSETRPTKGIDRE